MLALATRYKVMVTTAGDEAGLQVKPTADRAEGGVIEMGERQVEGFWRR